MLPERTEELLCPAAAQEKCATRSNRELIAGCFDTRAGVGRINPHRWRDMAQKQVHAVLSALHVVIPRESELVDHDCPIGCVLRPYGVHSKSYTLIPPRDSHVRHNDRPTSPTFG